MTAADPSPAELFAHKLAIIRSLSAQLVDEFGRPNREPPDLKRVRGLAFAIDEELEQIANKLEENGP